MSFAFDRTSRRLLAVLAEKEFTTPNLYPLSVNALTNGANQKTAREPIMNLREFEVEGALRTLLVEHWVTNVTQPGGRVIKWKHRLLERLVLEKSELAVLIELMLRGAQQPGELRSNSNRLHAICSAAELEAVLAQLEAKGLVRHCSPRPGERARRWDHTLYDANEVLDDVEVHRSPAEFAAPIDQEPVGAAPRDRSERLLELEIRVAELESRLERLEQRDGES